MEKIFWIYLAVVVALLTGLMYYRRRCASMIREYRHMQAAMAENNNAISFVYRTMVPDTVSHLSTIVRDQRNQMMMMCDKISYALENPNAVDLIAITYANARYMLATCLETCQRQGMNISYMEALYGRMSYDFDDDETIYKLYNLLNRKCPVTLYYFNKVRMMKERR